MVRTRASQATMKEVAHDNDGPLESQSSTHTDPVSSRRKRARKEPVKNETKPAPAAATKKQTRRKGRGSKLQQLTVLPLELLNLVFTFVQPYDLLRLSRTTKILRKMLLSRDAQPTWVASLASVSELPECPVDMSEPAFTQLMFDECCTDCYKDHKVEILWMLRIQLCNSCLSKRKFDRVTDPDFATKYPCLFRLEVRSLLPHHNQCSWMIDGPSTNYFLTEDCEDLEAQLKSMTEDGKDYQDFLKTKLDSVGASLRHAKKCDAWRNSHLWNGVRRRELQDAKDRRKMAIMARLDIAGYGPISRWIFQADGYQNSEIMTQFLRLKMFKDPKDLTDRIWSNAQPAAIAFLERHRSSYEIARWQFLVAFRTELLGNAAEAVVNDADVGTGISVPRLADLKVIPAIRQLLDRPLEEDGRDTVEPEEILMVLRDTGPQALVDICTDRCRQLMLEKIRARRDGTAHLELATSIFVCCDRGCRSGPMNHHQLATHRCWRAGRSKWGFRMTYEGSWGWADLERLSRIKEIAGRTSDEVQDCAGDFKPYGTARQVVEVILRTLRMDPATTSFAELDAKDPWLSCSCDRCLVDQSQNNNQVFDWRHLVTHFQTPTTFFGFEMDDYDYEFTIKLIPEADANRARDLREGIRDEMPPADSRDHQGEPVWRCVHCGLDLVTAPHLRQHALKRHGIEGPTLTLDYELSTRCLASAGRKPIILPV